MKQTQLQFIRNELSTRGYITRNFCLRRYISRLGARISDLKKEGMNIKGENLKTEHGLDYIYRIVEQKQGNFFS